MSEPQKSKSRASSQKRSIDQRILEEYPDLVMRNPKDSAKFLCIPCNEDNAPFKSGIWYNFEGHLTTKNHLKALQKWSHEEEKVEDQDKSEELNIEPLREEKNEIISKEQEKDLDFRYGKFLLQCRLPFSLINSLIAFKKALMDSYSSNLLKQYSSSRNKMQRVAASMALHLKTILFDQLKDGPFSLSVDTSSDINGQTFLAICAKFLEPENFKKPETKLISILPIEDSSTGETLFQKVLDSIFINEDIRLNFMGIVSDEGPNMVGPEKGLCSRLKEKFPYILVFHDLSHIYNTIFKKAIKAFPEEIVNIVNDICSDFARSNQKQSCLKRIQIENGRQPLRILRYAQTRWLSLKESLCRILELWEDLKQFYKDYGTKSEKKYFSKENEIYLRVLALLTNTLNGYNEYFQKENIFYDSLIDKIKEGFDIFVNYVLKKPEKPQKKKAFEELIKMPFEKIKNKDLVSGKYEQQIGSLICSVSEFEQRYFSCYENITKLFEAIDPKKKDEVILSAQRFILISIKYMKTKLPFNNDDINNARVIFFEDDELDITKLNNLKNRFTNVIRTEEMKENFAIEVQQLNFHYNKLRDKYLKPDVSVLEIWKHLSEQFPSISLLARALCVLPHSTVNLERIFTKLKEIKTPKRNRLTIENLEACLLNYQYFGPNTISVKPEMIENYARVDAQQTQLNNEAKGTLLGELKNIPTESSDMIEDYYDPDLMYIPKDGSKKAVPSNSLQRDHKKTKLD